MLELEKHTSYFFIAVTEWIPDINNREKVFLAHTVCFRQWAIMAEKGYHGWEGLAAGVAQRAPLVTTADEKQRVQGRIGRGCSTQRLPLFTDCCQPVPASQRFHSLQNPTVAADWVWETLPIHVCVCVCGVSSLVTHISMCSVSKFVSACPGPFFFFHGYLHNKITLENRNHVSFQSSHRRAHFPL